MAWGFFGEHREGSLINLILSIVVVGRVFVARGAVAEIPFKFVVLEIDFGKESDGFHGTILQGVVLHDDVVVDDKGGVEVGGLRADHVGVTSRLAEAIHMGVETIGAGDVVYVVADVHSCETVIIIAIDAGEVEGRD